MKSYFVTGPRCGYRKIPLHIWQGSGITKSAHKRLRKHHPEIFSWNDIKDRAERWSDQFIKTVEDELLASKTIK